MEETRKAIIGIEGVKEAKPIGAHVVSNKSISCMLFEFQTEAGDGAKISQTYVCPATSRTIKLSTSYRQSEAAMFKPVTQYVWQSLRVSTDAASGWRQYDIADDGFTVALPSQPQVRSIPLPSRDGSLRIYQVVEGKIQPSTFSIFVGQPRDQGIFEPDSMEAYLSGSIKSLVQNASDGKLLLSRRTTFRGLPALEYEFSQRIEGQPYVARGVIFMIDGGHMRVSMLHASGNREANESFKRFLNSFQLVPIAYRAAATPFSDPRGITFVPPESWIQKPSQNAVQAARFTHLTRSIVLLVAGTPSYGCSNFQAELRASGRLKNSEEVRLRDQSFLKLTTFEDVPKYKVRLTNVQYCVNSRSGAVVMAGTEEESMFHRWARVFEGTAASVRVR